MVKLCSRVVHQVINWLGPTKARESLKPSYEVQITSQTKNIPHMGQQDGKM